MFKKITSLFDKSFEHITTAAIFIGALSFLNQIVSIFRERLFATYLGVGKNLDIYIASFKIPDMLFVVFGTLFSVFVLLPHILSYSRGEKELIKEKLSKIFTVYIVGVLATIVVFYFIMPFCVEFVARGFDAESKAKVVWFSRILLISPFFLGASGIFSIYANLKRKFFVVTLSPIFYNIGIILGLVLFYKKLGLFGVIIGVILGVLMHFGVQLPLIIKNNLFPKFVTKGFWNEFKTIFRIAIPRTLGIFFSTLAFIVLTALATIVGQGNLSILNFSFVIQSVPFTLIGLSFASAAFPVLAELKSVGNIFGYVDKVSYTMKQILFFGIPVVGLFIILRAHIVRIILGSKNFSWEDTRMVSAMLGIFILSVIFQCVVSLLSRSFHAYENARIPLLSNFTSFFLTSFFGYIFIYKYDYFIHLNNFLSGVWKVSDIANTKILLIAFAYLLGFVFNAILLLVIFKIRFRIFKFKDILKSGIFITIGAIFASFAGYFSLRISESFFRQTTFINISVQALFAFIVMILVYLTIMCIFRNEQAVDVWHAIKTKFSKNDIVIDTAETSPTI